eukprot:jgi/Botrbrau1/18929/Bobra.177_2s0081.2
MRGELELADGLAESGVVPSAVVLSSLSQEDEDLHCANPHKRRRREDQASHCSGHVDELAKSGGLSSQMVLPRTRSQGTGQREVSSSRKRRHLAPDSSKSKSWKCVYLLDGQKVCGRWNPGQETACKSCGAFRWDGEGGQLRAQLLAILQTCDLAHTTKAQVLRRLRRSTNYDFPQDAVQTCLRAYLEAEAQMLNLKQKAAAGGRTAAAPPACADSEEDEVRQAQLSLWNSICVLATELGPAAVRGAGGSSEEGSASLQGGAGSRQEEPCLHGGDGLVRAVSSTANFASLLTGGVLRRRWNLIQSKGEYAAQMWPGLLPVPPLLPNDVDEVQLAREETPQAEEGRPQQAAAGAPSAVRRPLPIQTQRKLVRRHRGLGRERPLDMTESAWPLIDPYAEYERTMWVAASPFSIRKVGDDGTPQDTRPLGTGHSAFASCSSERQVPPHGTAEKAVGSPWEPRYPGLANPGGSPVGDLARWKAATTVELGRKLSGKGQLRRPNLPRLPCLEDLDSSVACVFETAAGLGIRADILESAVARYKATMSVP